MKAMTITQPYATLIATGHKTIETRGWYTNYRGKLAIHAGKNMKPVGGAKGLKSLCLRQPYYDSIRQSGQSWVEAYAALPLGAIVATCTLVDCIPVEDVEFHSDRTGAWKRHTSGMIFATSQEFVFGDYSRHCGRFAWLLSDIKPLATPIPATGHQGLWNWDGDAPCEKASVIFWDCQGCNQVGDDWKDCTSRGESHNYVILCLECATQWDNEVECSDCGCRVERELAELVPATDSGVDYWLCRRCAMRR